MVQQLFKNTHRMWIKVLFISCALRHIWLVVEVVFKSPSVPIGTPDSHFVISTNQKSRRDLSGN